MKIISLLFLTALYLFAQERLTGIVKPIYSGEISVSTDGIVSRIFKKEGDTIKKGQTILKLDNKLQKLETKRRKLLLDDTTQIKYLTQNMAILKTILEKKEILYKTTKAISLNELHQLRMQYINTKSELESLKENEKKELIEYKISAEVLEYYKLKSPINGVITKIEPKIGEWVQSGKAIVTIVDTKTCFVEVDLDVALLQKIKLNSKAIIEVVNGDSVISKEGKVSFISAVADNSSSLIRAKISFDNKDMLITPGVNASVIFR